MALMISVKALSAIQDDLRREDDGVDDSFPVRLQGGHDGLLLLLCDGGGGIVDVLSVVGSNDSLVASAGRLDMLLIVVVLDVLLVLNGSVGSVVESRHCEMCRREVGVGG